MNQLSFVLGYALPALGAAIGIGITAMGALNAFGRNPEKLAEIRTLMILGIVFADSLAFIGIIVAIIARFI
ncbi:MAG: H(+)-transporting ATPase [Candidatus Microsaccharimonas sossegonensis]|uniref:ATP synthase F(0) sector subunit c n=1 Tax=Candidatus Microsaccharimonas sossegonensis TaxID=2506948 RepID=A0A4Q0AHR5_9BACT|nr:MAG: H(+)-transporting ATPase [Candidatus Microsaccharimonas sossegonensis]